MYLLDDWARTVSSYAYTHAYYKGLSNSDNARLYDDAACVYCQTFYTPRALICLAPTNIRSTRFRACFNLSSTSTFVGLSQAAHYSTPCKIVIAENFSRKLCTRVIMSKTATTVQISVPMSSVLAAPQVWLGELKCRQMSGFHVWLTAKVQNAL